MSDPDAGEVQRLVLALGLAAAREDGDGMAAVLAGVDPETAGSVVVGLATVWVGALDSLTAGEGVEDPRAATLALLQQQALETAATT